MAGYCIRIRIRDVAATAGLRLQAMGRLSAVLSAILLGGCQPNRSDTLASCQMDADRFYHTQSAATLESPRTKYIIGCMAAHGYKFDFLLNECESSRPYTAQPACYSALDTSWLAQLFRSD